MRDRVEGWMALKIHVEYIPIRLAWILPISVYVEQTTRQALKRILYSSLSH